MKPKKTLIDQQELHKEAIKCLEKQIKCHQEIIEQLETDIDAIDEAETQEFMEKNCDK